jgi:1,4-dihydroxy-2-naphthoate octaprenyltransferase
MKQKSLKQFAALPSSMGENGLAKPGAARYPRFLTGLWHLADPKISLASMASIFLGTCLAAAVGPIHYGWLAVTVLGIFAIEVAKNASGEIFDFDSGTDLAVSEENRTPFSGGKRVLVDGLLTRKQTALIAGCGYILGIAAGAAIIALREPGILWIGIVGVLCAYFYHAPPFKLSYRGLGELAVAVCYGPLICIGTYLVQRGEISLPSILLSLPLGLLIANFLWINEFPDMEADAKANKRTLVVRFGRQRASRVFALIIIIVFVSVMILPAFKLGWGILFGMIAAAPAAIAATKLCRNFTETGKIIEAQQLTLVTFLLYALGAGLGMILS